MKTDMILAGVGGQGILSIAAVLGSAALTNNLYIKQAETHGMSQRGGDVQSYLRISDQPIYSDLIPLGKADLILSVEPMEALRYLPYLKPDGYGVTNSTPIANIPNQFHSFRQYPQLSGYGRINAYTGSLTPPDYPGCRHPVQGKGGKYPGRKFYHAGSSFPIYQYSL